MNRIRSRSRSRNPPLTLEQLGEQKKQLEALYHQNRIDLKKHVTDEKILESKKLKLEGAKAKDKLEEIDNLVKSHPIKQLHSSTFKREILEPNIYLNPYLVGITYMRRLNSLSEKDMIVTIKLTEDIKRIVKNLIEQSWEKKLAGTIFTADQGDLQAVLDCLKYHGAHKIGTEIVSDGRSIQGSWSYVSGGSLTFALNSAKEDNEAHDSASKNHMSSITGYLSSTRFTITASNYSDMLWIASCFVDEMGREIREKKVIVIIGTDKEAEIYNVLYDMITSLSEGKKKHNCSIKYGEDPIQIGTKFRNLAEVLENKVAKKEKDKLSKLFEEFEFVIALPGQLIIDDGIKKDLECMTVPFNEQLTKQAHVSGEDKKQHVNVEIYRRASSTSTSKNDLYEFGKQVCLCLDQKRKEENRAIIEETIERH